MRLRRALLAGIVGLMLVPAGAVAADQTPSAAGYSAADIPGVGSRVGGFAANSAAGPASAANAGIRSATAACTTGGVPDPRCAADSAAGCAVGDVAHDNGSLIAGSAFMTEYVRDRYGAYQYDAYLNATVLDPALLAEGSLVRGSRSTGSAELVTNAVLQLSGAEASRAPTTRAACLPNPCVVSASRATPIGDTDDSSVVLRLPFSPEIVEAGLLGLMLCAFACGASVFIARRRRRMTRTPPW